MAGTSDWLDPAAEAYLDRLVARLREQVPGLHGVYLIGSGALGGYLPGRSDLDVAAVTEAPLPQAARRPVGERVARAALPCPAAKLELVVYPLASVQDVPPSLAWNLNLNIAPGMAHIGVDPCSEPRHWFVLDVAMARRVALPLLGPPPGEVFAPTDRRRVVNALRASLDWHEDHDANGSQSVLNACRGWRYLDEGTWRSKPEAARWAARRAGAAGVDPRVIEQAAAIREGRMTGSLDPSAVRALSKHVRSFLESSAP